jgi:hypothetical protein
MGTAHTNAPKGPSIAMGRVPSWAETPSTVARAGTFALHQRPTATWGFAAIHHAHPVSRFAATTARISTTTSSIVEAAVLFATSDLTHGASTVGAFPTKTHHQMSRWEREGTQRELNELPIITTHVFLHERNEV